MPKADKYSAGGIYLGSAPAIRIDAKRFYPTIEKIIRALHRLRGQSNAKRRQIPVGFTPR